MKLDAHVAVNRGAFTLDLPLVVEPGEVVALIGSNGAGKSTFLHAIAGLVELDAGHVRLGGRVLDDVGAGIHVPAEARRCGLVFQDHLVFPHLTALENVAFGLRATGVQRAQAHACAYEWLKRLGMAGQAGLSGSRLSGGQAQRVALARALAVEPDALLLDEPFAALDEHSHRGVRDMLRTLVFTHARPVIIVIHDPTDARCVADRVVPLAGGRLRSRSASTTHAARDSSGQIAQDRWCGPRPGASTPTLRTDKERDVARELGDPAGVAWHGGRGDDVPNEG